MTKNESFAIRKAGKGQRIERRGKRALDVDASLTSNPFRRYISQSFDLIKDDNDIQGILRDIFCLNLESGHRRHMLKIIEMCIARTVR